MLYLLEQMNSDILSKRVALLKNAKPNEKGGKEEYIAKQKVIQLMGLLADHGRIDDIKKSSIDQEYLQSLLLEFGL